MRLLVGGLSVEPAADRRDDGRVRGGRRSRNDPSVVDQDVAGPRSGVSSAQAPGGHELVDGKNYIKISGEWKYLYRAVRRAGRQHRPARRAREDHGLQERCQHGSDRRNARRLRRGHRDMPIEMQQSRCLNDLVEQDHRAVKRVVRPIFGFKSFRCARAILAGIETMHMIKKGQLDFVEDRTSSAAEKFCPLAL